MTSINKVSFERNSYDLPIPNKTVNKEIKINGHLMHKNKIVAKIVNDEIIVKDRKFLPSYFKLGGNLKTWLENRCIDMHRRNSRLIRKVLSIRTTNEIDIVLSAHAHTLTDNYWIRLDDEFDLTYEDIQYSKDLLFDTALKGNTDYWDTIANSFNLRNNDNLKYENLKIKVKTTKIINSYINKTTKYLKNKKLLDSYESKNKKLFNDYILKDIHLNFAELTLGGSFEKGWKLKDNEWWLVKAGNSLNNSAELIGSYLGQLFKFNVVHYEKYDDNYVCCKNFTNNLKYDFEPMFDFMGENEDLEDTSSYIEKINPDYLNDFLNMIFLDCLILNPDRHTNNYGFIRDSDTGEFIGLAPNFDNNLALFATKESSNVTLETGNVGQIKHFYTYIAEL